MSNEDEYPACKNCLHEWTIIPAVAEWDVETAYLRHAPDCAYAIARIAEYDLEK